MSNLSDIFPPAEFELRNKIGELMHEWEMIGKKNGYTIVRDGFYPYYTFQKTKILFIAREGRYVEGLDYIRTLYEDLKKGFVGSCSINKCLFHKRIFKIAYGILIDKLCSYEKIPPASKMCDYFATEKFSFAFMNVSKISNETDSYRTNWGNLFKSLDDSISLIRKEIEMLNPDIIVSGINHMDVFSAIFPDSKKLKLQNDKIDWDTFSVKILDRDIRIINNYHFSYWSISDVDFYNIVLNSFKNHKFDSCII